MDRKKIEWKNGFTTGEELTCFFVCVLLLELLHDGMGQNVIALSHQCYLIFNEFNSCFRLLFMLMTLCNTIWLTVNVNSSRAALTAV